MLRSTNPRHLFALLMILVAGRSVAAQETWADKLGYPPGKRVVVLYASQLGLCYEANEAGKKLLGEGFVQSASVMPTCPWFEEFAGWCRQNPAMDVGIVLTMTSEFRQYRWQPVSSRADVPSLVDSQGYLANSVLQFSLNADSQHVQREIDAQIQKAKAAGLQPTHLAPHLGALLARPDLTELYLKTAMKHWIPAVMVELTPAHIARFQQRGLPIQDEMIELITQYPLPKVDDLQFVPVADSYEQKRDEFLRLLTQLKPGITQITAQPATESEALKRITDEWQQRVWDAQLLHDPDVRSALTGGDFVITSWREMMSRFEGSRLERETEVEANPSGPRNNRWANVFATAYLCLRAGWHGRNVLRHERAGTIVR